MARTEGWCHRWPYFGCGLGGAKGIVLSSAGAPANVLPPLLPPQGTPATPASLLVLRQVRFRVTSGPLHTPLPLSRSHSPDLLMACSPYCPGPQKGLPGTSPKGPEALPHCLSRPSDVFLPAFITFEACFVLLSVSLAGPSAQEGTGSSALFPVVSPAPTTAPGTYILSKYLWDEGEKINW